MASFELHHTLCITTEMPSSLPLNSTCGLLLRVCAEWRRRSIKALPDELFHYRKPKTKPEAGVQAFIAFLKKKLEIENSARRVQTEDITVGAWLEKFTAIETSPTLLQPLKIIKRCLFPISRKTPSANWKGLKSRKKIPWNLLQGCLLKNLVTAKLWGVQGQLQRC